MNVESLAQGSTDAQQRSVAKVSVIIVTYNYGHFLAEAIQSVLDQTFQDWELIVVDDGSTDNTREVVAAFADPRIRYMHQPNRGNPAARNTALKVAVGEYVAFLDADDVWFPEKLEKQVAHLDSLPPTVGLVYGDVYLFNHDDGAIIGRFLQSRKPPRGRVFRQLLGKDGWFISDTASLIRREVFQRVGLYDETLLSYEDWDMWVRIAAAYEVDAVDEPVARCRRHPNNLVKGLDKMYRYGIVAKLKVLREQPLSPGDRRVLRHSMAHHYYGYGIKLLAAGKRDQAWEAFVQSVRLRPGERKPYIHLGLPLLSPRLYAFACNSYSIIKDRLMAARGASGVINVEPCRSQGFTAPGSLGEKLAQQAFHLVCSKDSSRLPDYDEQYFRRGFDQAKRFCDRFQGRLDLRGKTVLDFGCGFGSACIFMALQGARGVVGVDIDERRIALARSKLNSEYASLSSIVDFRLACEAEPGQFDVIISKDSFQNYTDPEAVVLAMKQQLSPGGILAIGFGPLWKSPYGGSIDFMTRVPWAHLLFPESVIMRERRRFRPDENAKSFEEIRGGLNRMTLRKYLRIITEAGLEFEYLKTNVSSRKVVGLLSLLRRMPFCEEFFTINVYSIVRTRT